ncbi:MAG: diacylglycerol kinase [Candidatus Omnitrophica bacterium CG11_big_fil_rev_8_21_14_0_20_41_12]|nr:MAG: diacylglycerol kinase [Candidatus Omnitrophica bacterium CG11_big_fil_rev_8_21_14_0_20_41_12]
MIRWLKDKVFRNIFKLRPFNESLKIAALGIGYLFVFHRNMRIIFLLGILAFFLGIYFKLRGIEVIALSITMTFVFMAEILNTAIEIMMDMFKQEYSVKIKIIKDISAAAVLLASINALAVGYVLFVHRLFK